MKPPVLSINHAHGKIEQILQSSTPLCREDVVWMLEYIKKKVAEEDPRLLDLPGPRLIQNFHYFAEVAMMLVSPRSFDHEYDRLKAWLREASYGITESDPQDPSSPSS